ncbi:MAG: DNA polymerase III subunit delta [Bacteroidales bacterium]|nr:DNA polymerase III subunit delta [Bacteroidales bacterium]MDD4602205.1 DNA polymerase III subunit delta [Bacteroidales bacterium]
MAGKTEFTFTQLLADLKKQIYYPVYLLHGDEPYFIDVISDYIEQNVLSDLEKEFNQTILYGKDSNVSTIISYAKRFPMMANYQVLLVKEAQELDKIEDFLPYVEKPLSSTILVLCYKYGKLDKRKALYKAIEKQGVGFESPRLYDNKIPDWIHEYVQNQNYKISPKAAILLTEFLGTDLGKIVNEIQKLLINIPPGSEIDELSIEKNIGISKDYNVFELQKALAQKDIVKANRIILYFASNLRENPLVKIIPILSSYFSKVLAYHYLPDKSRNSVAAALSIKPFFVTDYQQAARSFPARKVIRIISLLREYDMKSKGVDSNAIYASDGELMKELIFKILH